MDRARLAAAILLILLVVGVAFFVLYKSYEEFRDYVDDIMGGENGEDTVNIPPAQAYNVSGAVGIGVEITLADGSIVKVSPEKLTLQVFPMDVYFQGQPISSIRWNLALYIDWQGDLTSLEISGPMEVTCQETGQLLRREGTLRTYTGSDAPKGQWFTYWSFSLDAEEIEYDLINVGGPGDYTLVASATLTVEASFANGLTDSQTVSTSTNIPVSVTGSGLTVIEIDITPQVFT